MRIPAVESPPRQAEAMIKIDQAYLVELGLDSLPDDISDELLAQIYSTLELRTGGILLELMGPAAVDEFTEIDESDAEARRAFLETHVPDYVEIGEEQFARLTAEIRSVVPQILQLEGLGEAD